MKHIFKLIFAFLIFILIFFLHKNNKFEKLEFLIYDRNIRNSTLKEDLPIVIVGITEDFEKEIGQPFSRKHYSQILKILKQENADIVVFDIFFPYFSENNKEDLEFLNSIKENGKVILPVFSPVKLTKRDGPFYLVDSIRGSASQIEKYAFSLGHINTYPDKDQIIRKFPAYIKFNERIYPQLGIEIYRIRNKINLLKIFNSIPLDQNGCFYIRYISPKLINKYFISFSDVLKRNYSEGFFNKKTVIIGQTIVGAKNADLIPTPFGTQFGVFVQACAIGTNLSGKYIIHKSSFLYLLFYAFFLAIIFSISKIYLNTFYTFGFIGLCFYSSKFLLDKYGIFFDVVPLLFFTIFYYLSFIFYSLFSTLKKLFQKEIILKLVKQTEQKFTGILNPVEAFRKEEMFFLGFGSEEIIEKTPLMILKTILLSSGIESGCLISFYHNKFEIIAKEGEFIEEIDIYELIKDVEKPKIINKSINEKIKNIAIVPILSFSDFKIYGIFINKKSTVFSKTSKFTYEDINFIQTLSIPGIIAIQNSQLNLILKDAQLETIFRLAVSIEYRDRETGTHIHRVSEYAYLIAEKLGFKKTECTLIKNAMPLHDIGKIAIPDNILLKPGTLTAEERKIIEKHPIIGAKMLEGSKSIILKAAEIIALSHHEKYDGTGYPYGLSENKIPIYGRIAALSDVFDALTSDRIYKSSVDVERAFKIINEEKGKAFDPKLVEIFTKSKDEIIEIQKKFS
ncbi:MAG: CHASE2 domain-containing protein [Candidatus Omnitrophica bacterium]|nr:CHASE2 domain-containing protein [Candidatus Omnitrophota bacterium]MCM8802783.1 CHASE2 domain-containing protein [Candidatus Omnitrophota bacterium]